MIILCGFATTSNTIYTLIQVISCNQENIDSLFLTTDIVFV